MRLPYLLVAVVFCVACPSMAAQDKSGNPLVIVKNGRYGFIDRSGTIVIAPQLLWAEDFDEGMASAYVCGRMISIDPSGQPHPLRVAKKGELSRKKVGDKYAVVNSSGQMVTQPIYDDTGSWSDGAMAVKRDGKWGYVDKSAEEFIQAKFEEAYPFISGVANADVDGQPVIINKKGEVIYRGGHFMQGVSDQRITMTNDNDKSGFLDLSGKVAIPFVYDSAGTFGEGLAPVRKGEKWGYIDAEGKLVINFKFDEAAEFARGLAAVKLGNKSGFINHSEEFAFPLDYQQTSGFMFGDVARFWTSDGKFGYVNTSGSVIWGPTPEQPDHWPLLGMDEDDKKASCEGISDDFKSRVMSFPSDVK